MKNLLILFITTLFFLTSSVVFGQNIICEKTGYTCPEIDSKNLVSKDGLFYERFTAVPYTGNVKGADVGFVKNGKKDKAWVGYDEDGNKMGGGGG